MCTGQEHSQAAGPLEALLLAIEFARLSALEVGHLGDDGEPDYPAYEIPAREWEGLLECAGEIGTRKVKPQNLPGTRYTILHDRIPTP